MNLIATMLSFEHEGDTININLSRVNWIRYEPKGGSHAQESKITISFGSSIEDRWIFYGKTSDFLHEKLLYHHVEFV